MQLQDDFWLNYKSRIPSYGCIIFNKTLDKVLFCLYHNPRDKIPRKLDFPKGKVDEDETPIDCALREVQEETHLELNREQINEQQFVKVETRINRMVTLYFVEGVEMNNVLKTPKDRREVQER